MASEERRDADEETVDQAVSEPDVASDEAAAEPDAAEEPAGDEAGAADEPVEETADGDDPLTAARREAAELKDRYARLRAEWDNFRKRTAAERDAERARAAESLVLDLLPALDDIERALKHAEESGEGGSLVEGVTAIQSKFLQILGKHKVEQIVALDEPFDATRHQAIGTTEDESVPEETVVQEYQKGYIMADRVIRPSMVVTSTGGGPRPTAEADEDGAGE